MPKRARDFDDWDISSFEQGTDGLNLFVGELRGAASFYGATELSR